MNFTVHYDNEKEKMLLELDFYKDDISPVYCLPWCSIPELHNPINTLINTYIRNLPKGDLYHLHDKIPEFKIHFDDSDKNILQLGKQKMQYYSNFENHLRNNIGNDSSRLLIKNDSFHQLSDGKWRLNQNTKNVKSININTKKGLNNIRVTGTFYYPPGGMKEWHTNKTSKNTPDWRCYFIYLTDPNTESYFCYINPITGKFHKMRDKHMTFNIFYLNNDQERLLWHSVKCVKGGRMSFGFNLNPSLISGLMGRLNLKPQVG